MYLPFLGYDGTSFRAYILYRTPGEADVILTRGAFHHNPSIFMVIGNPPDCNQRSQADLWQPRQNSCEPSTGVARKPHPTYKLHKRNEKTIA